MPDPTLCNAGGCRGDLDGFYRGHDYFVACYECCCNMTPEEYQKMVEDHQLEPGEYSKKQLVG